jgi:hypothetical protein
MYFCFQPKLSCPSFDRHIIAPTKTDEATYYETLVQIWNQSVYETLCRSKHFNRKLFYLLNLVLGAKKRLYKRLRRLVGRSVHSSVRPSIGPSVPTMQLRGKLVTSRLLREEEEEEENWLRRYSFAPSD